MKPLLSAQYLRAFGALGVVAFHTGRASVLGMAGVDIFFVLSGFIMWMVTIEPVGPARFLWRRAIRVVPLYWIATLAMVALRGATPADTVRSLLFVPYRGASGEVFPVLLQGWTLNFEMFFYLLFAATLVLSRRRQLLVITAVLCGLSAAGIAFRPLTAVPFTYTNPLLMEFLAGVWNSELVRRGWFPGLKLAVVLFGCGLAGFAMSLGHPAPVAWRFVAWGLPAALLVGGLISIEARGVLPTIATLKWLGDGSYSIYLFHPFVFAALLYPMAAARLPGRVIAVSGVVIAAGVGVAAFQLLERPLTTALRRPRPPVVLTAAAGAVPATPP